MSESFEELPELEGTDIGQSGNGKTQPNYHLESDSFSITGGDSIPRFLLKKGESFVDQAIKGDLPSKQFVFGVSLVEAKSHRHNCEFGQRFIENLMGGLQGLRGKRADLAVDAHVGERRHSAAVRAHNFKNKITDWFAGDEKKGE